MNSRYLIINADDFGMCRAANKAVGELLACGGITSSTIMMPCGWAPEAVKIANASPDYAVGVHLTFTSEWSNYRWGPVGTRPNASLRDKDGYFFHECKDFEEEADLDEVRDEIVAQIEKAKTLGLNPSHIDNHMGSLYGIEGGRLELLNTVFDVAAEYKLPFRFPANMLDGQIECDAFEIAIDPSVVKAMLGRCVEYACENGVAIPDYLIEHDWDGPQSESYENFREFMLSNIESFPNGVTETYIHPSVECDELKGTSSVWHRRVWEYELFKDSATRQHIESCGIKLINYRDLAKMKA